MAKLYFRYAAMNAGKSTALLQAAHNYEERGMRVALFTAALDERGGTGVIGSRLGLHRSAAPFGPHTVFTREALPAELACLLIDEAQFLSPAQVHQLHRLANRDGLPVICYGLRSDFQGQGFPGAIALLTLADDLEEMKTDVQPLYRLSFIHTPPRKIRTASGITCIFFDRVIELCLPVEFLLLNEARSRQRAHPAAH